MQSAKKSNHTPFSYRYQTTHPSAKKIVYSGLSKIQMSADKYSRAKHCTPSKTEAIQLNSYSRKEPTLTIDTPIKLFTTSNTSSPRLELNNQGTHQTHDRLNNKNSNNPIAGTRFPHQIQSKSPTNKSTPLTHYFSPISTPHRVFSTSSKAQNIKFLLGNKLREAAENGELSNLKTLING